MTANDEEWKYARNPIGQEGFFATIAGASNWCEPVYQSKNFSYCSLFKVSCPGLVLGSALLLIGKYLPFIIAAHIPPVALTLLIVTGGCLLAYGMLQGLKYATSSTLKAGFDEDVEELHQREQRCWDRLCTL